MAKTIDDPDWTLGCAFMRMPQGWATVHTRVRSQGGYFVLAVADRLVRVNRVHSGGHLRIRESAWAAQYEPTRDFGRGELVQWPIPLDYSRTCGSRVTFTTDPTPPPPP